MSSGRKAPWWADSDSHSSDRARPRAAGSGTAPKATSNSGRTGHSHDGPNADTADDERAVRGCLACSFSASWRQQQTEAYDHALAAVQEMVAAARCLLDAADGALTAERARVAAERDRRVAARAGASNGSDGDRPHEQTVAARADADDPMDPGTDKTAHLKVADGRERPHQEPAGPQSPGPQPHRAHSPYFETYEAQDQAHGDRAYDGSVAFEELTADLIDGLSSVLRDVVEPLKPALDAMRTVHAAEPDSEYRHPAGHSGASNL